MSKNPERKIKITLTAKDAKDANSIIRNVCKQVNTQLKDVKELDIDATLQPDPQSPEQANTDDAYDHQTIQDFQLENESLSAVKDHLEDLDKLANAAAAHAKANPDKKPKNPTNRELTLDTVLPVVGKTLLWLSTSGVTVGLKVVLERMLK